MHRRRASQTGRIAGRRALGDGVQPLAFLHSVLRAIGVMTGPTYRRTYLSRPANAYMGQLRRSAGTNNLDLFLEANYHFHMLIADMSRISFLGQLLEPLWMHIGPWVRQSVPNEILFQSAARHHQDVYEAIAARQPDLAVAAIREDIVDGYNF